MTNVHDSIVAHLATGPLPTTELAKRVAKKTRTDVNEVVASCWDLQQDRKIDYHIDGTFSLTPGDELPSAEELFRVLGAGEDDDVRALWLAGWYAHVQHVYNQAHHADTTDDAEVEQVLDLAKEIRRVDGNHRLGACALAEALVPYVDKARNEARRQLLEELTPLAFAAVNEGSVDNVDALMDRLKKLRDEVNR